MKEITARLWENKLYGTTYAKGLFRKALYNGTLELNDPYAKYLVDFEDIEHWFHFAKSPLHIEMANRLSKPPSNESGVLMSWLYRYEGGVKTAISGYAALDTNYRRITIQIDDIDLGISEHWELPIRSCIARTPGKSCPSMIATTLAELDQPKNPPQKPSTNGAFVGSNMQALEDALMRIAH
jgi:hypothetical protein